MNSPDWNKGIIRRIYEEFFNNGNAAVLDDHCALGYVHHDLSEHDVEFDMDQFKQRIYGFRRSFSDMQVIIDEMVAEETLVCTRSTIFGTHDGELQGIPPTGRRVQLASMVISRFEDGVIVEEWELWDKLGMFRQLGVDPFRQAHAQPRQEPAYQY